MMLLSQKLTVFVITYDDGEDGQVLRVPHVTYNSNSAFRKNVTHTKCLDCNLEFNFEEKEK